MLTLLRYPERTIAYVTYQSALARRQSRKIREIAKALGLQLAPDARSLGAWQTSSGGGLIAIGVGGALTSLGVHHLVIDDPYKSRVQAESSAYRAMVTDWWGDVGETRIEPGGSALIFHTRWTTDDLIGHVHDAEPGRWTHVHMPAVSDDGAALWPERWSIEALRQKERAVGPYTWASLYQGRPRPRGESVFAGDVHFYDELPKAGYRVAGGADLAYTAKTYSDYSVLVVLLRHGDLFYVVDVLRMQVKAPVFSERAQKRMQAYPGARVSAYLAGTEHGAADLMADTGGLDLDVLHASADKFLRAQPVAAAWNAGKILLPRDAEWTDDFLSELRSFTGTKDKHDDQVDALAAAYDALDEPENTFQIIRPKRYRLPMATLPQSLRQASARTYRLWTVGMLRAAEARADAGDLRLVGDLIDAMRGDDRIPGVLRTRVQGLLGLDVTFEASGDGRRKNRAVRALEAEEDWWEMLPEDEHSLVLGDALLAGICPAELDYYETVGTKRVVRYRGGRVVPKLTHWHVRALSQTVDGAWQIEVDGGERVPFTPGDGHWCAWMPYGTRRPWVHGLWRSLAPWWLLKQYARDDYARVGEKGATTVVEWEKDSKVTSEMRKDLANTIYDLARDGVVALPQGATMKLIETSASTQALYKDQIELANSAIAAAVLGHSNNAEVKGANTGATAGENIRYDLRKYDAQADATTVHAQVLPSWAGNNFGDPALAPWPLYAVDPPEDKRAKADTFNVLGDAVAKLVAVDKGVDVRAILEDADVPILKGAPRPEDISPPEPPPAPPAPPGGQPPPPPGQAEQPPPPAAPQTSTFRAKAGDPRAPAARGQTYVDSLSDAALKSAALVHTVEQVLAAVNDSTNADQLRTKLVSLIAQSDDPEAETMLERLILLSTGMGTASGSREADT